MKTLALFIVALPFVSCGSSKSEESTPQFSPTKTRSVYVTGDSGVAFKGSFGSDGSTSSISGVTPQGIYAG